MRIPLLTPIACLYCIFHAANGSEVLPGPFDFSVLSDGHSYLEGPSWAPEGDYLVFTDQSANRLYKWSQGTGTSLLRQYAGKINGTTWDTQGRLLLCESALRRINRITVDGDVLVDEILVSDLPNEPNDIVVHSNGTIWFTTPYWGSDQSRLGQQHVYRYDPESDHLEIVYTSTGKPNGLAFSPDESVLYVALYQSSRIIQIDLDAGGLPAGQVTDFTRAINRSPDGMKVDDRGYVYVIATQFDEEGILIFSPSGEKVGLIRIPESGAPPTNLAFGPDYLYVTAGTIVVRTKWAGFPEVSKGQVHYTSQPVIVDGDFDPAWIWTPGLDMKHPIRLFDMFDADDLIPEQDDLSAEVRVLWDFDNLYLLALITDENPQAPYADAWFRDDIFEVYLDTDLSGNEGSGTYDGENDWELGFPALAQTVSIVTGPNSVQDSSGIIAVSKATESGYLVEVALPWSVLGASEPIVAGKTIGADFHVVDNDNTQGQREHKLAWASWNDEAWRNTTVLGELLLHERDVMDYWPSNWTFLPDANDGSTWAGGGRFASDWMWMSLPMYPWAYHLINGWSYLYPIHGHTPWAWSLAGEEANQWAKWD